MCGRFLLVASAEELRARFGFSGEGWLSPPPRYNIAPTQPIMIVRRGRDGPQPALVRWGLVPTYVKDPTGFRLLVNGRAETVTTVGAFRGAIRYRRCLVPATGYYAWRRQAGGQRQPFLVRPRAGGVLAMAGLWETWAGADGSEIDSAVILTTAANDALAAIHPRMPAILAADDFALWLGGDGRETGEAVALLRPAASDLLEAIPVGQRVDAADNDDASLIEPIDLASAEDAEAAKRAKAAADRQLRLL